MDSFIESELIRLTQNAAIRREELLKSGLQKSHRRKALNIAAGMLALLSAGAITSVIANVVGKDAVQLIAAGVATISGALSLVITAYYSDDEILNMLTGASKYLALRESVFRIIVNPKIEDEERYALMTQFQDAYAKLDETYARYFSLQNIGSTEDPAASRTQINFSRGQSSSTKTKPSPIKPEKQSTEPLQIAEGDEVPDLEDSDDTDEKKAS